jgi:hypothetical protein
MEKRFIDQFILVEYNGLQYPKGYSASMQEVAAHFDKKSIDPKGDYSLHTEYSYGTRKLDSCRIAKYPSLREAQKNGVPQLWKSVEWANEFAEFLIGLTAGHQSPKVIEIHPPFNDYCTLQEFAERFRAFEKQIHTVYPDVILVIENRAGKRYRGGNFLVRKAKEIAALCEVIREEHLDLGIVLDFPQLLTGENINPLKFREEKYEAAIETLLPHSDLIKGIHVWGKRKNNSGRQLSHHGNFDTYFGNDQHVKTLFLSGIQRICSDGSPRFLVPEVNSGEADLSAIINDLSFRN